MSPTETTDTTDTKGSTEPRTATETTGATATTDTAVSAHPRSPTPPAPPATARIVRQPAAGADDRPWSADPYTEALRTGRGPLFLRRPDGRLMPLEVERWCAEADAADLEVLRRCEGSVLDVGCGPGRLVAALGARGGRVLGIDVSEAAVARTVRRGGQALRRSVFEPLPGEGRWGTALLVDGNVGIGGDPHALLDRMAELLAPGGLLIAETVPAPELDERVLVQVADALGAVGSPFPWARLGTPALLRHAGRAGWRAAGRWTAGGRSFAALRNRGAPGTAEPPNRNGTGRRARGRTGRVQAREP